MIRRRSLLALLPAAAAAAYLIAMVVAGALPQQKQLVRFEAKGVMKLAPERIDRVGVTRNGRTVSLLRQPAGWKVEAGPALPQALAARVSMAVQFMNTAGPLRILDAPELTGSNPRDFGLEPARVHGTLFADGKTVLGAAFGAHNPDDTAQYMGLDGRPELYLMSRFVGQEWEAVADGLALPKQAQR